MIPTLTTERLTLRAPRLSDFEAHVAFKTSDRAAFVGGKTTAAEAWHHLCALIGQWQLRGYGRWMVTETATDRPMGVVGIHHPLDWPEAEIGWTVYAEGEGKGYACEAAKAARSYAYDTLGWSTIASFVNPDNARSVALAKRLGCRPDGIHQHELYGPLHIWRHPSPTEIGQQEVAQ
jgi:ribosomal-protein-alanine N-acetyltransferase